MILFLEQGLCDFFFVSYTEKVHMYHPLSKVWSLTWQRENFFSVNQKHFKQAQSLSIFVVGKLRTFSDRGSRCGHDSWSCRYYCDNLYNFQKSKRNIQRKKTKLSRKSRSGWLSDWRIKKHFWKELKSFFLSLIESSWFFQNNVSSSKVVVMSSKNEKSSSSFDCSETLQPVMWFRLSTADPS